MEEILREAYSHPNVEGIVMWTAWRSEGCYRMCLTDNNFNNLATGDVVDKLLQEWGVTPYIEGKTDPNGFFEASLSHGHYQLKLTHNSTLSDSFQVHNMRSPLFKFSA